VSKIQVVAKSASEVTADAVALYLFEGEKAPGGAEGDLRRTLAGWIRRERFEGRKNEVLQANLDGGASSSTVYLVVGLGKEKDFCLEAVREAVGTAAGKAAELWASHFATVLPFRGSQADEIGPRARAGTEGALLAVYRFDKYLSEARRKARPFKTLSLIVPEGRPAARASVPRARATAEAVCLARDLVNEPALVLTPKEMERRARAVARAGGLSIKVLGPAELKREKMGAYLAVAQGSDNPPRLIHLSYRPGGKSRGRVALVGKGLTFDSGGLSLKSNEFMLDMKCDMSGSAAVLGVMSALPALEPRVEVHGLLAMAENMPSARAYRPGDVLVTRKGKTVEVNNTDAEGRLVLADVLSYAQKLKPTVMIDLATLTGACVVALGPLCSGVMGNNPGMIEAVLDAASVAGEKMWPLPLFEEYLDQLKSEVADLKNTGERYGGALTAGLFLREFVDEKLPWVHLDIAGPAFGDKELPYAAKGGTGAGVRTVLEYLMRQ
jgi:leucyl aminopeptidase